MVESDKDCPKDLAGAEPVDEERLLEEELDEVAGGVAVRPPTDPAGFHYRPLKTGYEHPSRKQ